MASPVFNVFEAALESWTRGPLYAGADVRVGPKVGVKDLGISYSEVPPGKSGCPFHNHHVEDELFIIIQGEGTYRFGKESYPIKAGDVLGAPAGGQDTAHQIINTGTVPLRYFGVSTMSLADVCEYPDSGKFGVFSRHTRDPYDKATLRHLQFLDNQGVDYWVDEPGAEESKTE
ncbi:MAG: cupin domain-containing protein [Devosia sp.]